MHRPHGAHHRLLGGHLAWQLSACLALLAAAGAHAQGNAAPQRNLEPVSLQLPGGQRQALYDASYALVIGASKYRSGWRTLPGVLDDVKAVSALLTRQGFEVSTLQDPTRDQLDQALRQFVGRYGLREGNRLLVYFAGHGHTDKSGDRKLGYIVPVDAPDPNKDPGGFIATAYSMGSMEEVARQIRSRHALFIFDSCFSGTIFRTRNGVPDAISDRTSRPVRQFITAGDEDQTVPDKSIFRRQLERGLGEGDADLNRDGYITGSELGDFLHDEVTNYTTRAQTPQHGKIRDPDLDRGDIVFLAPRSAAAPAPVPRPAPAPVLAPMPAVAPAPQTQQQTQPVPQQSPAPAQVALSKPEGGAAVGGALMATDRRASGTQVEDQAIELKGESRLRTALGERAHLSISSYNRTALITGEVAREADRELAERTVRGIENVNSVVNEAAVAGLSSLTSRANDTLISSKVKASFVDANDLQANSIKVVGERGIIYLMGRVTEREATRAAEVARGVSGVQKVVRVFETISEDELKALQPRPTPATAPAPSSAATLIDGRYQVLGDGSEVKDLQTGLVWARCSVGQTWDGGTCAGKAKTFTIAEAQKRAGQGWRVPSARELGSLVYCSSGQTETLWDSVSHTPIVHRCDVKFGGFLKPTIHRGAFPNTVEDSYWAPHFKNDSQDCISFRSSDFHQFLGEGEAALRLVREIQ